MLARRDRAVAHHSEGVPSIARKKRVPPRAVKSCGCEYSIPGLMSLTKTVPAAVPSLFHNSTPSVESYAVNKSVPATSIRVPTYE